MKKTTRILAALCTLLNTSLTYTSPGDGAKKTQTLNISSCNHSRESKYVTHGTTDVDVLNQYANHSAIELHIPLSVKKINLTGSLNHSTVTLYMRHNPEINQNFQGFNHSTIQVMHPIRQYTYHIIAASIIFAGGMYYLYSQAE